MEGAIRAVPGGNEIRLERGLHHSVDAVWAALTQPERLVAWLAEARIELAPGGQVLLRWLNTDEEGNTAVATGTITAVDPPRLLEYDTDIHGLLRWEVRPHAGGSLLTFTCVRPEPDPWLAVCAAGWQIHLDHLEAALAGKAVDWPNWTADYFGRWERYRDRYAAAIANQETRG